MLSCAPKGHKHSVLEDAHRTRSGDCADMYVQHLLHDRDTETQIKWLDRPILIGSRPGLNWLNTEHDRYLML